MEVIFIGDDIFERKLPVQQLIDGLDVDEAVAAVEGRKHFGCGMLAAEGGNFVGAGAVGGKIHAAQERMASPCAGELVGALFGDEKIAAQRGGDFRLLAAFAPGQLGRLVLGVVLQ